MFELKLKPTAGTLPSRSVESQQPRKQLLALILLLVTFCAVIVKDRDFWFGTDSSDIDMVEPEVAQSTPAQAVARAARTAVPAASVRKHAKTQSLPAQKPADSGTVIAERTALPALDVEVIAGDKHKRVHPGSNSETLAISSTPPAGPAVDAAEREPLATTVPAAPSESYPLLAQQMKVQGSVVLQALIGSDGVIENLRVLSGPGILASAARQAVSEWKFKPILQNGQAVESQAKITVNFTIKIADGSAKTTLAESQPLTFESLSR